MESSKCRTSQKPWLFEQSIGARISRMCSNWSELDRIGANWSIVQTRIGAHAHDIIRLLSACTPHRTAGVARQPPCNPRAVNFKTTEPQGRVDQSGMHVRVHKGWSARNAEGVTGHAKFRHTSPRLQLGPAAAGSCTLAMHLQTAPAGPPSRPGLGAQLGRSWASAGPSAGRTIGPQGPLAGHLPFTGWSMGES